VIVPALMYIKIFIVATLCVFGFLLWEQNIERTAERNYRVATYINHPIKCFSIFEINGFPRFFEFYKGHECNSCDNVTGAFNGILYHKCVGM